MPIHPDNKARYPKNWSTMIVPAVRARSGGRCECTGQCGQRHKPRCTALNHLPHPITDSRVVLTVAHLDHTPENCDMENLRDMCQRCHLKYDAKHHAESRARRAHAAANTRDLPL